MADITPYKSKVLPTGRLNTTANPYDFGSQTGDALSKLAGATEQMGSANQMRGRALENAAVSGQAVSNALYQLQEEDEVTRVHTEMAAIQARGQERVAQMANETQPGDKTYIQRVGNSFNDDFAALEKSLTTPKAQQLFQTSASSLRRGFETRAVEVQAGLEAKFAVNQGEELKTNLGAAASNDPTQVQSLIEQGYRAIDDKNGRYRNIDGAAREKLKADLAENIKMGAAIGLARRDPNAILDKLDPTTLSKLKEAQANPTMPGEIPNLHADHVDPYTSGQVYSRARQVAAPTKYDQWIEEAAAQEGIDPRELKLRIAVESNFNPAAKSDQGAVGIMQFEPGTAKKYGINPNDPRDAIFGGAKVLANYIRQAGGDMSKVDMMYYGGESGTGWGPNTKQYAANLSAVRQAAGMAATRSPESFGGSPADKLATLTGGKKIQTGHSFIDELPWDKQYAALDVANRTKNAREQDSVQAEVKRNKDLKAQQEAFMSKTLKDMGDPKTMPTMEQIADAANGQVIEFSQANMLQDVLRKVQNEQNAENKQHPKEYNDFVKKIFAPDDDPNKIYNDTEIYKALRDDKLSGSEYIRLRDLMFNPERGAGVNVKQRMTQRLVEVEKALAQNPSLKVKETMRPGTIAGIARQYFDQMNERVEEYRAANKNPMALFNDRKDANNFYNPEMLDSLIPKSSVSVQQGAVAKVAQANTEAAAQMKIGDTRNGWTYVGGNPADKTSWKK